MKQNYESGRSMVEMLGTLAIIGVLSIGGIVGYNYAINKYRANETINEINMRLMTLQNQSGQNIDLNLNEFPDVTPLGYTIGDNYGWAEDDTRIYVGLSNIQQRACEIIYDEMIKEVERIDITADRTANIDTLCGDNNEMKFYIDSGVEAACEPPCADDEYCANGIMCVKEEEITNYKEECATDADCSECSGASCKSGFCWYEMPMNGQECDGGNGICANGICTPKEEIDTTCTQNSDCPTGQYCARKNSWGRCSAEPYGCAPIELTPQTITLSNGQKETWYVSKYIVDWWNAEAMCAALGKKMPTKAELSYLDRKLQIVKKKTGYLWTRSEYDCSSVWVAAPTLTTTIRWETQAKANHFIFNAVCR